MSLPLPGIEHPGILFFYTAKSALHAELASAQQDPNTSPEVRKAELWGQYLSGIERFRSSSPTAVGLEQLATLFGRYLYWEVLSWPTLPWEPKDAELGAAIRSHLLEEAILEEALEITGEDLTGDQDSD
jgi:hypothetical protein